MRDTFDPHHNGWQRRLRPFAVALSLMLMCSLSARAASHTFYPAGVTNRSTLPPQCSAHVYAMDGEHVRTVDCGAAVQLTPGSYAAWIEWPGRISRFAEAFDGAVAGVHSQQMTAAAALCVEQNENAASYEIWHLDSQAGRGPLAPSFHRDAPRADQALQLPAGRAVAFSLNARREVIAVSEPLTLADHGQTSPRMLRLTSAAALCVFLRRPAAVVAEDADAQVVAVVDGELHEPDAFLNSRDYIVGVWYHVKGARADVRLISSRLWLPAESVTLHSGRISTVRTVIRRLPSVQVAINIEGDAVDAGPLSLSATMLNGTTVALPKPAARGINTLEFLPRAPLHVRLDYGSWKYVEEVDLTPGADTSIQFDLRPIVIHGRVTYGKAPASDARVEFSAGKLIPAETDDDGRYRMTLWKPGRYAFRVQLKEPANASPFLDTIRVSDSEELDIDIPRAAYSLKVRDASSGDGIAGAQVTITNEWHDASEGRRRIMSRIVTGADGVVGLPPLREGNFELRIDAEGYEAGTVGPQVVDNTSEGRVVEVALKRLTSPAHLRIMLPGGVPASGAELIAITSSEEIVYAASSDRNGEVRLPAELNDVVLVARHPNAGGSVLAWPSRAAQPETTWSLPPAGPPLTVRALIGDGVAAASMSVFAWIGGRRVGGLALAFLAFAQPLTDSEGEWRGRNLPAAPLALLAVSPTRALDAERGAFDTVAETIPYPWPPIVEVHAR